MTTTTTTESYLPLPPASAVWVGEWEGEGDDRARYFKQAPLDIGDAMLTIHGVQYASGRTGRSIVLSIDEAIQSGGDDLTPLYARRLAAMLQNLADTCEILDGERFGAEGQA
jgi:hypothetical protein